VVEKDRLRFSHAPLVLAVVARLTPGHKVPEQEQLLSGGALCFQLLLAADAMGFGAQWLTGWAAYDPEVSARLGLAGNERILGFIHLGTAREAAPERERPDAMSLLSELAP
jgi:nitroreductase